MKKTISLTLLSLSLIGCTTPLVRNQIGNQQQPEIKPTPDVEKPSVGPIASKGRSNQNETSSIIEVSEPINPTNPPSKNPTLVQPPKVPTQETTAIVVNQEVDKNKFNAQWTTLQPITRFTTDISFVDFYTGWAVGRQGVIKKTTDAGKTWTDQSYGDADINSVSFVNKDVGFIANRKGMLYKTIQGGEQWIPIDTPLSRSIDFMKFFDENNGVIYGFSSIKSGLYITRDGGKTWKYIYPITHAPARFEYVTPENGILFSIYSPYAKVFINDVFSENISSNGGQIVRGVAFKNPKEGYLFGNRFFLKTVDGGNNWEKVSYITTQKEAIDTEKSSIYALSFANELQGVMITNDPDNTFSKIYLHTSDGGITWKESERKFLPQNQDDVYSILHFNLYGDFNHGWALLGNQEGIKAARLGSP